MLPSFEDAIQLITQTVQSVNALEAVSIDASLHRMVAAEIVTDREFPPFNRSQMDGYAVIATDIKSGVQLKQIGTVHAGGQFDGIGKSGTCVSIATGAPVPRGYDAVVQHELTDCGEEEVTFHCAEIASGTAIHPKGIDAKKGQLVISVGTTITPLHVGILAACGYKTVAVFKRMNVLIVSSGNELVSVLDEPDSHQIRNSNGPMLAALFASFGCDVDTVAIKDDLVSTNAVIQGALKSDVDLIVTIGGISAGKKDFMLPAFQEAHIKQLFHGVQMQPGKPVYVGMHNQKVILGLPGNPVSAIVCGTLFGKVILNCLCGIKKGISFEHVPLHDSVKPNPNRDLFRPCICKDGSILIPQWQGSGDLMHTQPTTGIVLIPKQIEVLKAGAIVQYLSWD